MHSRKSRRALGLDLRTNSLESRQLLATPTATVAMFLRTAVLTKTALVLGAQQYVVWPSNPRLATVTLTKPLTVHQAAGFTFTTQTSYPTTTTFLTTTGTTLTATGTTTTTTAPMPSTPNYTAGPYKTGFFPASKLTIKAGTKVTFQYGGPGDAHFLKLIEARYAAPLPHH